MRYLILLLLVGCEYNTPRYRIDMPLQAALFQQCLARIPTNAARYDDIVESCNEAAYSQAKTREYQQGDY